MELVTTPSKVSARGRLTMQPGRPRRRRPLTPLHAERAPLRSWPNAGLAALLALTLGLRLWGIKQGLPFSYNADEAQHFVPRAIGFFGGDWNPHYFLNPPAYSYLLAIVFELWFGSVDAAVRHFGSDPTAVFVLARVVCALLGTLSVWLLYGAGVRLLGRRGVALAAAAIYGLAFLPTFYSHLALNDVPTLFGVCLALYGVAGIFQRGRLGDYLLAGLGVGLAAALKYTGGWVLALLLIAAVHDGRRPGEDREDQAFWAFLWTLLALGLALLAFSAANPYWFLDFHGFTSGVSQQASAASGASEPPKLGTTPGGGILYYLWTFSWGLGLGPTLAAAAGALMLLLRRRRWWLAALLIPAQVAFIVFMGLQVRYFGRWLLPVFPTMALLAAWTAGELIDWCATLRRPLPRPLAAVILAVALGAQSLVTVVHNDMVLSRAYTTNLARAWMVAHIPAGENVYIEPVIPGNWTTDVGGSFDAYEPNGARWYQYPTWLSNLAPDGRPLAHDRQRYVTLDQYEKTLYPGLITRLEAHAFCWVVSGTLQSGRAFVEPQADPAAVAYYRELARVGRRVYSVSPYAPGARPVPFGFDWSIDYYPRQYAHPGPQITIYRLSGGACAQ